MNIPLEQTSNLPGLPFLIEQSIKREGPLQSAEISNLSGAIIPKVKLHVSNFANLDQPLTNKNIKQIKAIYELPKPLIKSTSSLPVKSDLPEETLAHPSALELMEFYGLNTEEIQTILAHSKIILSNPPNQPLFIRRTDNHLPRSIVWIPDRSKKGLYVLLKEHGNAKEIGRGSFNRATLAIHLGSGKIQVFRSGQAEKVSASECDANQLTANFPEHFAAGIPIKYQGPIRPRNRDVPTELYENSKEYNVDKVGFIMDLAEGGTLCEQLSAPQKPPMERKQILNIARQYARNVAKLHELGLVHLDQKVENTFMTSEEKPLIGDFGFTVKKGQEIKKIAGTPGMVPPELIFPAFVPDDYSYIADFSADIWSMGCIFADLIGSNWYELNGQKSDEWKKILDPGTLEELKAICFPDKNDPLQNLIRECLHFNPAERPTAHQVAAALEEIWQNFTGG